MVSQTFRTEVSDRPIFCCALSLASDTIVVGGADHGLTELNAVDGSIKRRLYPKTSGHTDWVASVAATTAGFVSGGVDCQLCLWNDPVSVNRMNTKPRAAVAATHLSPSHSASVTAVIVPPLAPHLVFSASHDGSIMLWDMQASQTRRRPRGTEIVSNAPSGFTHLHVRDPSSLIGGCRGGEIVVVDTTTSSTTVIRAHRGPIGGVTFLNDCGDAIIATCGAIDGLVRIFDLRLPTERGRCVGKIVAHGGGVTDLQPLGHASRRRLMATVGGGDGSVRILELMGGAGAVAVVNDVQVVHPETSRVGRGGGRGGMASASTPSVPSAASFAYCMTSFTAKSGKEVLAVAWGDGRVNAIEISNLDDVAIVKMDTTSLKNAVRCMAWDHNTSSLFGAGDDGILVKWTL